MPKAAGIAFGTTNSSSSVLKPADPTVTAKPEGARPTP